LSIIALIFLAISVTVTWYRPDDMADKILVNIWGDDDTIALAILGLVMLMGLSVLALSITSLILGLVSRSTRKAAMVMFIITAGIFVVYFLIIGFYPFEINENDELQSYGWIMKFFLAGLGLTLSSFTITTALCSQKSVRRFIPIAISGGFFFLMIVMLLFYFISTGMRDKSFGWMLMVPILGLVIPAAILVLLAKFDSEEQQTPPPYPGMPFPPMYPMGPGHYPPGYHYPPQGQMGLPPIGGKK